MTLPEINSVRLPSVGLLLAHRHHRVEHELRSDPAPIALSPWLGPGTEFQFTGFDPGDRTLAKTSTSIAFLPFHLFRELAPQEQRFAQPQALPTDSREG